MLCRIARLAGCLLLLIVPLSHTASAEFLIIPVPQKINNVVTVAERGAQFNDIRAALDSITDAASDNRYTVFIAPGHYTVSGSALAMKPYVDIIGSGRDRTVISGSISTTSAERSFVLGGADHAALKEVTIRNDGGDVFSYAIGNFAVSPTIEGVTVEASGGTGANIAVFNSGGASPTIKHVTATATSGNTAIGIRESDTSASQIIGTQAYAEGASDTNIGIDLGWESATTVRHVHASAIGGTGRCHGLDVGNGNPDIAFVTATATGNDGCYGISGVNGPAVVRYSETTGTGGGISLVNIEMSTVGNGHYLGTCFSSVDENGTPLDSACEAQPAP